MIFTLTIGGDAKELLAGSLEITLVANGRSTASFELLSEDRSYRPALDAEVFMEEDGEVIFGGLVDKPDERGFGSGHHPGITTTVNVVDFAAYTERRFVNLTIPAGTLKAALQALVPYLTPYGVSLDAGQVDGPSLPDLAYDDTRLDAVLNELATLTADAGQPYFWNISHTKVLGMYQPSTQPAPFNLVGNTLPEVVGDIEVETARSDDYANKIILKVPPQNVLNHVETFTGDGTTYIFPLRYQLTAHRNEVFVNGVRETLETIGLGFDLAVFWQYDPGTNSILRVQTGVANPPALGDAISITFDGVFSGRWEASDASFLTDPWERVIVVESIPDGITGQAFADAELAKRVQENQTVNYVTWEQGIVPGQEQTINVSARNVNATAVITSVRIHDLVHRLVRSVTAVVDQGQTNLSKTFQDDYKTWWGDKTGAGAVSAGAGLPSSTGAAPPDKAVQFNNGGAFGGDAEFIYYAAENSVVCGGGGTSITATRHESCQAFGYDCHIGAPPP